MWLNLAPTDDVNAVAGSLGQVAEDVWLLLLLPFVQYKRRNQKGVMLRQE